MRVAYILPLIVLAVTISGCSTSQLKANMTQIKEVYSSINSMSGTAILKDGTNDTVMFTFVKPDKLLIWYSTRNEMIVYNGTAGIFVKGGKTEKIKEKPFNPFDYDKIIENGKAYVSGNNIVVENGLGKVWLNEKLLPVKIEWKRGVEVKILKLSINGQGDEKIIEDLMGNKKEEKVRKLVSISEAEKLAKFSLILPEYTANCRFIGAIVSNGIVTLYYGNENSKELFTIVEAENSSLLNESCGMIVKSIESVNGVNVKVGTALGKWNAYGFRENDVSVIIYGNVGNGEMIKIVESMLKR